MTTELEKLLVARQHTPPDTLLLVLDSNVFASNCLQSPMSSTTHLQPNLYSCKLFFWIVKFGRVNCDHGHRMAACFRHGPNSPDD